MNAKREGIANRIEKAWDLVEEVMLEGKPKDDHDGLSGDINPKDSFMKTMSFEGGLDLKYADRIEDFFKLKCMKYSRNGRRFNVKHSELLKIYKKSIAEKSVVFRSEDGFKIADRLIQLLKKEGYSIIIAPSALTYTLAIKKGAFSEEEKQEIKEKYITGEFSTKFETLV